MSNGTIKAKVLGKYGFTSLCQETVGEWIINIGFKYNYTINTGYMGGHEKKYTIW